jgi:hypothetical protein
MELNPYQPPVVAVPTLADEQHARDRPAPRPIGIWILSGLHLLAGLFFVAAPFLLRELASDPENFPVLLVAVRCAIVGTLALASSIGMWRGARWGWWTTAFCYVWALLGVVANGSTMAYLPAEKLMQLAVNGLILLYLFKSAVRDYFCLKSLNMSRALVVLAIVAIVLMAAMSGLARVEATTRTGALAP